MQAQHSTSARSRRLHFRAGLAPLELVMALPLMLCVMALMINFGNAATWKIRAATSARLVSWRSRPLWDVPNDPKPTNMWPSSASLSNGSGSRVTSVDSVWNQPLIAQGWIKGPVFTAQNGYLAIRDKRVNEMSEGIGKGNASVSLTYPFMPGMGNMSLRADHTLAQTLWQYHSMGYSRNTQRRARGWWNLEDSPDWMTEKIRFMEADRDIVSNPDRDRLTPLDREPDLFPSRWGSYQFDFYPRAPVLCVDDVNEVRSNLQSPGGLLEQIPGNRRVQGVVKTMASTYLRRYQVELNYWDPPPPSPPPMEVPPPGRIAELKLWINQLEALLRTLP